jgi:hypothetical protein
MIYVDSVIWRGMRIYGKPVNSCHMFSDLGIAGDEELHAMAAKIGLKRSWLHVTDLRHYDLTAARRKLAIHFGAKEADREKTVEIMRKVRGK